MKRWWQTEEYRRQLRNEAFALPGGFVAAVVVVLVWPAAPLWWMIAVVLAADAFAFRATRRWHRKSPSRVDAARRR